MKLGAFTLILFFSLATVAAQSGRVPPNKPDEKPATGAEPPTAIDSSHPVLVNMTAEEQQKCGIFKLSSQERECLDRWLLTLLVKLQSLPQQPAALASESTRQADAQTRQLDLKRQQLELDVRDLQMRLTVVRQQAGRMTMDLRSARTAAARGDWASVQSYLSGLESSLNQIQQAAQ